MAAHEDRIPLTELDENVSDIKDWKGPVLHGAILKGCAFMKHMLKNQDELIGDIEKLHAFLSISTKFDDKEWTTLNINTDTGFLAQNIWESDVRSGPRTCHDIDKRWGRCNECPNFGKVSCPINIKPDDYIETKELGFWEHEAVRGKLKRTRPAFKDLVKFFNMHNKFVCMADTGLVYVYNGSHWEEMYPSEVKAFCERHMDPSPTMNQRKEFLDLLKITNLKRTGWLDDSTAGLINLQNGVYDIVNDQLLEHSSDYGFRYILPYQYDSEAKCPRFMKFLKEITCGRSDLAKIIIEFMGYAISNCEPTGSGKALILYGSGSNGKSTLMNVFKALAGKDNYSSLSLSALNKDTKRYLVDGKLFNIGEETSVDALGHSEVFKTMVTGGEIDVKRLYTQDYTIKNRCKLIMACNELPKSGDRSDGLYRRVLLIPFDARFEGATKDVFIDDKLKEELPGILNLAVQGYKRLMDSNLRFTHSAAMDLAIEEYKIENDNVLAWIKECAEIIQPDDPKYQDTSSVKDHLYNNYKLYAGDSGSYKVSKAMFFRRLKNVLPGYEETRVKGEYGRRERRVKGISLIHN